MTEARVKGERWNKVKLRGQRIPGINMARKVSLRDSFYIQKRKKEKKKKRKEGRKGGRKGRKGRKGGREEGREGGREEKEPSKASAFTLSLPG